MFEFLFVMFNFDSEDIDEEFLNYDVRNGEFRIFGKRVYLNLDLVSQETKIPQRGGDIFSSWKTLKLEKNHMAIKICREKTYVQRNGSRMQDILVPPVHKTY